MPVYDWTVDNTAESVLDADVSALSDTVLFLDLDGVFSPYRTSSTFKKEFYRLDSKTFVKNPHGKKPKNYHFKYSSTMVDDLWNVFMNPSVSVVWLSTWREFTVGVMSEFGYRFANPSYYLPWGDDDLSTNHEMKSEALMFFLSSSPVFKDKKVAWVDDLAFDENDIMLPVDEFLLLSPDSDTGLSKYEVKALKKFVK